MSNVKEIYVEAKRSKNFQTFTVGATITIEEGENVDEIMKTWQHKTNQRAEFMCDGVK